MGFSSAPAAQSATGSSRPANNETAGQAKPEPVAATQRSIIYSAQVSLVVEDLSQADREIRKLVQGFDGYVSSFRADYSQGEQRQGRWVLRIPVPNFESCLAALAGLGIPESQQTDANDVTEEYVDLQARLANKKVVEERILKLLQDRGGDIKDVIAVETELGRVREEIERMEGRIRYLTDMTALSTVTITGREEHDYVPPQAPTFLAQIGQTWSNSLGAMRIFGQAFTLFLVAIAPWLPPVAIMLWGTHRLIQRWRRQAKHAAA